MALVFPSNPIDGQLFDRYIYNDAKGVWDIVPDDVFPYYVGPTKPTSPKEGMAWFNTENGNTYMYYDDGVSGTSRTNLVTNPSFETTTYQWWYYGQANVELSSAQSYSGTNSALVTYTVDDEVLYGDPQLVFEAGGLGIDVLGGQDYTASIYIRQVSSPGSAKMFVSWRDSSDIIYTVIGDAVTTNTSSWTRISITETAPIGAVTAYFGVLNNLTSYYADAAMVEQSSTLGAYIEGTESGSSGSSGQWVATSGTLVVPNSNQIALLDDVTLSSLVDGDVITYDTTSASWINSNPKNEYVRLNPKTISENLTIPSGYNGTSAGPITISDGVVVTVADGSAWSVV